MNLRTASKREWDNPTNTLKDINAGSLQRIADATEIMTQNYSELIGELDRYKRWCRERREITERLERSNAALRGVITKLKKRLETEQ